MAGALAACATSGSGSSDDTSLDTDQVPTLTSTGHLRLVAGNLTSGNFQAYLTPGIDIFKGVNADVAMIQEFNVGGNTTSEIRTFVDQAFGTTYSYARGAASEQIPNGIVSRYPIIASGEWADSAVANRQFEWAQIDIPGSVDLYAISVHLLSSNPSSRNTQAAELKSHIAALPAGSYVVLGGDFNTDSRTEACISTLSSVLSTASPYPVDQAGLGNTNENRNKPYDWVLPSSNLRALETAVTIGASSYPTGLVVDTRKYTPIADLAPAVVGDSGASNMQHMAVVRDFLLPDAGPTTSVTVTSPNGGETWTTGAPETVTWTSTGVTSVKVELSTNNGSTWTTLSASTAASAGQLATTAPSTAATAALVRVTSTTGTPTDSSDAPFAISTTTLPPPTGGVFLNEILANEPGSDINGEFIEIVNGNTTAVDLSGWTLSDAIAVRHTFASGTTVGAGKAIVVFGGASGIPAGVTNAVAASTGTLSLGNSGDTVKLASASGTVDSFTYTSALAGTDGVSMNRSPDASATGTFVLHTTLSAASASPGTRASGTAF